MLPLPGIFWPITTGFQRGAKISTKTKPFDNKSASKKKGNCKNWTLRQDGGSLWRHGGKTGERRRQSWHRGYGYRDGW